MDEYIKREDALKIIDSYSKACTEEGKVVADAIRDIIAVITPTADVVPKSEYDAAIIDRNAARLGMIVEHERLKTARADVAREIFADIEREIKNHGITYAQRKISELKKKYTEER